MNENLKLYTSNVIISEDENEPDVLNAKFIICNFDNNKNKVRINKEKINNWLSTLVNKPLLGKIKKNLITSDFTGHNIKLTKKKDENGKEYTDVDFDTSAFGTFIDAQIEKIDGVDYITADAKIWKRFKEACSIIQKRAENGELHTSWEISVNEYHKEDDIKVIDDGVFIGHTLLGSNVEPAYDCSGLLSVASADDESCEEDTELSNALINDLSISKDENCQLDISNIINEGKGDEQVEDKKMQTEELKDDVLVANDNVQVVEDDAEKQIEPSQTEVDSSALTVEDIYNKLYTYISQKLNSWFYIAYLYPLESRVIVKTDKGLEEDFLEFTYSEEGGELQLSEPVAKKLSFVDSNIVAEKDSMIQSLQSENETIKSESADKNDALVISNNKINELSEDNEKLKKEISELSVYKEQVEQMEAEKHEQELAEKRKELKALAISSKQFTEEELESSEEIKALIENLDVSGIKSLIADRLVASLSKTEVSSVENKTNGEKQVLNIALSADNTIKISSVQDYLKK